MDFYQELAKYEIGWWKAHHRRDKDKLTSNMVSLYKLQFNIPHGLALKAVKFRVDATKEHDLAEKLEDEGIQAEADKHWKNAEELLMKHFKVLYRKK